MPHSTRSPLLAAALTHAEHGYSVFPVVAREKRPITSSGFKAATREERTILHRWEEYPDANIGIACGASGIAVLDIDPKAGADPEDVLGELDIAGVPLVHTGEAPEPSEEHPNSLSGVRGAHLYFSGDLPGTSKLTVPGTEIRGRGQYLVAPPSIHPSGVAYEGILPPVAELPPVPDWLLEMIAAPGGNGKAPTVAEVIPAGARNSTLASIAGTMRRRGMGVEEILGALNVTNEKRCRPPLPPDEVAQIAASVGRYAASYTIKTDDKGRVTLPPSPDVEDVAAQCEWLTAAFNLDRAHPITAGRRQGIFGPEGHVELRRADAPPIRFEPASRINAPMKLIETLSWRALHTDAAIPAFKAPHCQQIAHVIRMLCGAVETLSDEQEAAGIVATFMSSAVETDVPVTTYGGTGQRYEAAIALRRETDNTTGRPLGQPRYGYDVNTGEVLVAVSDLADAARHHIGSSLARGWLDARMAALGWHRITLQGYALPGRDGRKGPHARIHVYRGLLAREDGEDPVNT